MNRRSQIIAELTRLSRNGWEQAKSCDYEPLELELRELDRKPLATLPREVSR